MKKAVNKGTMIILASTLLLGLFAGCTKSVEQKPADTTAATVAATVAATEAATAAATAAPMKQVTLTVLHNWNGSKGPADEDNNPVAKVIKAKTGVTLHFEYTKGNEVEKINTIFATQTLPDIYTGPAWGGERDALVKAAKEEQLVDLTGKLDKYPNLAKEVAKEHVPASLWDNVINAYGGKQFILYTGQPAQNEDAKDWLYHYYIRKDIAAKTGMDMAAIKTKDDLYNLLKKIKELGLKQNGKPIIPAGGFGFGWALDIANLLFMPTNLSIGFSAEADGKFALNMMTKPYEDAVLYYRKLISEGLIDPEAFTQTEAIAREKITQGRDAMIAAHYPAVLEAGKEFLKANPGTDYIPVGPLAFGGIAASEPAPLFVQGDNLAAITKKTKDVDAALRVMNFLASDEGWMLTHYGIEGTHYDMVNGKPVPKKEWADKFAADPTGAIMQNEGFGFVNSPYGNLTGLRRTYSLGNGEIFADPAETNAIANVTKIIRPNGIKVLSGYTSMDFIKQTPQFEALSPLFNQAVDVWRQAVYTKSDAAAMKVINDYRAVLNKAGLQKAMDFANEQSKGKDMIKVQFPN